MAKNFLRFHDISFSYENSPVELFNNISFHAANGWSGIIGVNGSGKSTLMMLACGLLKANAGKIDRPVKSIYCEQRTDEIPETYSLLLNSNTKNAIKLIEMLGLQNDWIDRWDTLSHGERKRAQIASALFDEPELLAIDEPTNHLDINAKEQIAAALKIYRGIGLLVSHDRELVDMLCNQCIFIEPPNVSVRPGGITEGLKARQMEDQHTSKQYDEKLKAFNKLNKELLRRKEKADAAKKKSSKRNISRKDHDAKSKIDLGRLTGKDATAGRLKKRMDGRINTAKNELASINVKREYQTGIWLPGSISKRNTLINIPSGTLTLAEKKILAFPDLIVSPTDRIGITGINGSGKSSLIRELLKSVNAEKEHITYIPQEICADESKEIIKNVKQLPNEKLGHLMIVITRLGSDPKRVLDTDYPSPGETRKLLLGLGMLKLPYIIIMDEPTNHMDITSITCLEDALVDCPCALLLVSHDHRFLKSQINIEWNIEMKNELEFVLHI
ncbi:ATP-binding cassette domain-containing protein [Bacteroidota bacterium]